MMIKGRSFCNESSESCRVRTVFPGAHIKNDKIIMDKMITCMGQEKRRSIVEFVGQVCRNQRYFLKDIIGQAVLLKRFYSRRLGWQQYVLINARSREKARRKKIVGLYWTVQGFILQILEICR